MDLHFPMQIWGLVHGIAHTLSAHFGLSHGMANATVLPYVMEFNAESCPEKMVELAKAIKLPLTGDLNKDKYLFAKEMKRLSNKSVYVLYRNKG